MKKKIAVFTGTRAEYGLLFHLMKEIQSSNKLELQVIVSGAHLSADFGETWKIIKKDGFKITSKVDMSLSSDSSYGITKSMGFGMIAMADAIKKNKPHLLVILGDRYEALVAAQAAMIAKIPIAHIHGGESSEGAIDEAIRHSITKMSHLHFTSAVEYSNKVIQLGEQPSSVWNVGAVGLDNISKLPKVSKKEIESYLQIKLKKPTFLVTYHPVTLDNKNQEEKLKLILSALDTFNGTNIITGTNADEGNQKLRKICIEFCNQKPENSVYFENLGTNMYLNVMKFADLVVGNSSSGIIEAPSIGTPTINIGSRQNGRLMAPSVISCRVGFDSIISSIKQSLTKSHIEITKKKKSPFGKPGVAKKIINILSKTNFDNLLNKKFYVIDMDASSKN